MRNPFACGNTVCVSKTNDEYGVVGQVEAYLPGRGGNGPRMAVLLPGPLNRDFEQIEDGTWVALNANREDRYRISIHEDPST